MIDFPVISRYSLAVLVKLSKWLLVAMLTFSFGMPWVVLQSVAWLGMAVTYSRETCFTEALAKTFDGRHPCKLCKFVAENQKSEKKPDAQKVETKFDPFCASKQLFVISSPPAQPQAYVPGLLLVRNEAPPLPPPRQLPG
jgi:hypothetical protein